KLKNTIIQKDIIDYILKDSPSSIKNTIKVIDQTLNNYDINILLVQEDHSNKSFIKNSLEKIKLNITAVDSLEESFKILLEDKNFSLLILDMDLSNDEQIDYILKVREKFKKDSLGIIVISSDEDKANNTNFIKFGANDFIIKPFIDQELKTKVNSVLEILKLFKQNHLKELQIFEQKKQLQMSELLGNIAHQWRQPLNTISVSVSGIKIQKTLGLLNDENLDETIDTVLTKVQSLSQTINLFTNLISETKEKSNYGIKSLIDRSYKQIKEQYKQMNIDWVVSDKINDSNSIDIIDGAMVQIFTSLIDNSKEIFETRSIKNGLVSIDISLNSKEKKLVIKFEDNGGGIDKSIMNKIFNPYFTTYHQSQGKGLGLYLVQKIITESLNGTIEASNVNEGVTFLIELPLK
ncbi:MAG: hybrid sensor histidine kinase/response regulator, partial [Campylobacterales bacterium]|nr:hybrid sensor histidine kinase/response regulator [Campylobacterales bacterium]